MAEIKYNIQSSVAYGFAGVMCFDLYYNFHTAEKVKQK